MAARGDGKRRGKSRGRKRSPTDALRGVVKVRLRDGSLRYRACIPGGRRGAKTWTPLVETPELAAELRRRMQQKLEALPAVVMTFEQAIEATRADFQRRCRPGTVRWFDCQVAALTEHFGRMLVAAITPHDIERFAARQVASKVSASTVQHRRRALRAVLSCVREQMPNGDPLSKVRRGTWPKVRRGKVTAPEPEEVREFLRKTIESASPRARQDHDIVAALYLTGLRRAELARLRAEDIRADQGRIFVQGKVRDEWLPVNAEAVAVLERMAERVDRVGGLVPGGVEEIARVLKSRSARNGIQLSPHALRRAFVTALIRAGHDVATVARYSRHTTDEIERYMAANEDDRRVLSAVSLEGKPPKKRGRSSAHLRRVE